MKFFKNKESHGNLMVCYEDTDVSREALKLALKYYGRSIDLGAGYYPLVNRGLLNISLGDLSSACEDFNQAYKSTDSPELKEKVAELIRMNCNSRK